MEEDIKFIKSLHKPYNASLKSLRWVCEYSNIHYKLNIKDIDFREGFYIYLIDKLSNILENDSSYDVSGIPQKATVEKISNYLGNQNSLKKIAILEKVLKNHVNKTAIEKNIYSTYKASSYYITLAKNSFNLIDKKNKLTELGYKLISINEINDISLGKSEQDFFIELIAKEDLFMFVTQIYFNYFEKKYTLIDKELTDFFILFINEYTDFKKLKKFNYTKKSLQNYMYVRTKWIESLDILDSRGLIKPITNQYIKKNAQENILSKLILSLKNFENLKIKEFIEYKNYKSSFINSYNELKEYNFVKDFNYVNLYSIKDKMKLSFNKFQFLLSKIIEDNDLKDKLQFSNIVHSIDARKRFIVRNIPVLNISIKEV